MYAFKFESLKSNVSELTYFSVTHRIVSFEALGVFHKSACILLYCILTLDRAVDQRFSERDTPV